MPCIVGYKHPVEGKVATFTLRMSDPLQESLDATAYLLSRSKAEVTREAIGKLLIKFIHDESEKGLLSQLKTRIAAFTEAGQTIQEFMRDKDAPANDAGAYTTRRIHELLGLAMEILAYAIDTAPEAIKTTRFEEVRAYVLAEWDKVA
jgi:predicted transcriptional regulator